MEGRNGNERKEAVDHLEEEGFLRGIYRKASHLEYERRETARVLINRRRLRRQWFIRLGVTTTTVIGLFAIMQINSFDLLAVLSLSSVLIVLGLFLEHIELRMGADKD